MEDDTQRAPKSGQRWQRLVAYGALGVFAFFCIVTILLVGFRAWQSHSTDYDVQVLGYTVGKAVRVLLLPLLVLQAAAVVAAFRSPKAMWQRKVALIGGAAMLLVMATLYLNVSEMLMDDLSPAVRARMQRIGESLDRYYSAHSEFPASLTEVSQGGDLRLPLEDPYAARGQQFEYWASKSHFMLLSPAPDRSRDLDAQSLLTGSPQEIQEKVIEHQYDPTNGIFSKGDLIVYSAKF
jgi:hypothetical protein